MTTYGWPNPPTVDDMITIITNINSELLTLTSDNDDIKETTDILTEIYQLECSPVLMDADEIQIVTSTLVNIASIVFKCRELAILGVSAAGLEINVRPPEMKPDIAACCLKHMAESAIRVHSGDITAISTRLTVERALTKNEFLFIHTVYQTLVNTLESNKALLLYVTNILVEEPNDSEEQ